MCVVPYSGATLPEKPNTEVCTGTDAGFDVNPWTPPTDSGADAAPDAGDGGSDAAEGGGPGDAGDAASDADAGAGDAGADASTDA